MSPFAKAKSEIINNSLIADEYDDTMKQFVQKILNQTPRRPDDKKTKWDDGTVAIYELDIGNDGISLKILAFMKKDNEQANGGSAETCNWEAPILFENDTARSYVVRIQDVLVAAGPAENDDYGKTFVYVGLPAEVRSYLDLWLAREYVDWSVFNDARFLPDSKMWWRTTRSLKSLAMTIATYEDGVAVMTSHSVADILKKTRKEFTITAYVKFAACAKTTDGNEPEEGTIQTVSVNILHGVLQDVNDSREGPVLVPDYSAADPSTNSMLTSDMASVHTDKTTAPSPAGGNEDNSNQSPQSQLTTPPPGHLFSIPPSFWEANSRLLALDSGSLPLETTVHPSLFPVFLALRTNQAQPRA